MLVALRRHRIDADPGDAVEAHVEVARAGAVAGEPAGDQQGLAGRVNEGLAEDAVGPDRTLIDVKIPVLGAVDERRLLDRGEAGIAGKRPTRQIAGFEAAVDEQVGRRFGGRQRRQGASCDDRCRKKKFAHQSVSKVA